MDLLFNDACWIKKCIKLHILSGLTSLYESDSVANRRKKSRPLFAFFEPTLSFDDTQHWSVTARFVWTE
jgi:hypothetical protein